MTIRLKYIGTQDPYFETTVTGSSRRWKPNETQEVAQSNATALYATGLFVGDTASTSLNLDASGNVTGLQGPSGRKTNIHNLRNRFFASLPAGERVRKGDFLTAIPQWSSASFTATITGTAPTQTMVTTVQTGTIQIGHFVSVGQNFGAFIAYVVAQTAGTMGAAGTYTIITFSTQSQVAAALTTNALVQQGYTVQNGGNSYSVVSVNDLGGGLVSTIAPTGTGAGAIATADTIKWLYNGPVEAASPDQSDTPNFYIGLLPASCTQDLRTATTGPGATVIPANIARYTITGSNYSTFQSSNNFFNGIVPVGYPNSFKVEFVTDATVIAYAGNNQGPSLVSLPSGLMVNGAYVSPKGGNGYPFNFGSVLNTFSIMDFGTKERKLRIVSIKTSQFNGIWVPPEASVFPYISPNSYRLYVEGDSVTQGASPSNGMPGFSHRLSKMLGCNDVWDSSVGGTGFINFGGGSTLISRIPKVIAAAPDILYVNWINNDVGNSGLYTSASRQAVYKQYFDTLLAALPDLIIICAGGYATGAANLTTDAASAYQVEQDMATAIANYNHPHVKFLPTISDTSGRWLYGNGHVGTTVNSTHGNSDWLIGDASDQLHPNFRYYPVFCLRVANGIINIMNSLMD